MIDWREGGWKNPGAAALHAVLRAAERLTVRRATCANLEGQEALPTGGHTQRGPHHCAPASALDPQPTARSRSSSLIRTSTRGSPACLGAHRASARRSIMRHTFIGPAARNSSRMEVPLQVYLPSSEWGSVHMHNPIHHKSDRFGRFAGVPWHGIMARSLHLVSNATMNYVLVTQGTLDMYWRM